MFACQVVHLKPSISGNFVVWDALQTVQLIRLCTDNGWLQKTGFGEHGDFKTLGEHEVSVERLRRWLPISGLAMLSGRALRMVGIAEASVENPHQKRTCGNLSIGDVDQSTAGLWKIYWRIYHGKQRAYRPAGVYLFSMHGPYMAMPA